MLVRADTILDDCRKLFVDQAAVAGVDLSVGSTMGDTLVADRERLVQVLSNLIGNALKFTSPGGRVTVNARADVDGGHRFAVTDSGPGIPPTALPHLFDRRWQGAPGSRRGLGLGLYIAKLIVEAHGGRIFAESPPGGGSRFTFVLPATPRRPSEQEAPAHLH